MVAHNACEIFLLSQLLLMCYILALLNWILSIMLCWSIWFA